MSNSTRVSITVFNFSSFTAVSLFFFLESAGDTAISSLVCLEPRKQNKLSFLLLMLLQLPV
jgi:hypothetical protein